MKPRIRVDSAIASALIILTGFLYFFQGLYSHNLILNGVLYFLGQIFILKGAFLRMAARGHKKAFSENGAGLVTTGLYQYVRNPMYLGTFFVGCGFVLIVWPWWALPFFALLFFWRFNKQIIVEENHLRQLFGKQFDDYCRRVPRFFPVPSTWLKIKLQEAMSWSEMWSTKERSLIIIGPLAGALAEFMKEKFILGAVLIDQIIWLTFLAVIVFALGKWLHWKVRG